MYYNHTSRDINQALPILFRRVLRDGSATGSRNGDVRELTHVGVTLTRPLNREILLPERKANLAAQIAETMWVLSGRDDIAFLNHYLPRAAQFSDDQKVWRGGYGKRLRSWETYDLLRHDRPFKTFDQIKFVVDLLKADPLTRRAVVAIYDPEIDSADGLDIPCNNWLHFLQRNGSLDLHVAIRSNDLMWGWSGINQFEWSALLEVVASLTGFDVGSLHFSISSLHVYEPHWEKGQKIAASVDNYKGMGSPRFTTKTLDGFDLDAQRWFATEEAVRTGKPITVDAISDPMLRAWMRVIQWWWTGDERHLDPINGTALYHAAKVSLQPPARVPDGIVVPVQKTPFLDFVIALHEEKHAAYGDSWKRRGEMLGIMANIARKIDRLGVGGAGDTAADTAIDLLVYLVKYRLWLTEFAGSCSPLQGYSGLFEGFTDNPEYVAALLRQHSYEFGTTIPAPADVADSADLLRANFEDLEHAVTQKPEERATIVDYMIDGAMVLANALWLDEQHA